MASYRLLSYEKEGQCYPRIHFSGSVFDMQQEMGLHVPSLVPYNSVDTVLANWDSAKTLLTLFGSLEITFGWKLRDLGCLKIWGRNETDRMQK